MIPTAAVKDAKGGRKRGASPLRPATALPAPVSGQKSESPCACGGSCSRCLGGSPVHMKQQPRDSDDPYEREADRIAGEVMRIAVVGAPQFVPSVTPLTDRQSDHGEDHQAGRTVHDILGSAGRPLDAPSRAFLEPRLGRGLADVRTHTGPAADNFARSISARAFTVGNSIVFANGEFAPEAAKGRHLLVHELVHVLQQSRAKNPRFQPQALPSNKPDPAEDDPAPVLHNSPPAEGEGSRADPLVQESIGAAQNIVDMRRNGLLQIPGKPP